MSHKNLAAIEIKAFVPAREFSVSLDFYKAMGFVCAWQSDSMAYFHHDGCSFMLQNFHVKEYTENFMMHLLVENADDWHRELSERGIEKHFKTVIGLPEDRDWGIRDFTLVDPSGVLWRIGHSIPDAG